MNTDEIKKGSNKSFGIVFSIVFLIIAIWPLKNGNDIRIWSIIIAILFLSLGLINSRFLTPLNNIWLKFGELIGKIVSPIVMGIIYFLVITPIGLFMRIIGKDLIGLKLSKQKETYWIKRQKNITSMKRQF